MASFFYDGQIRRYITQIIRLLSNFNYQDGDGDLREIPVLYGDLTRQVSSIINDNSENKIPSVPRMAVYITGLEMDRERTSDSSYISKVHIRERALTEDGTEYLNTQGKNYTVERLMPTPYTLRVNADIWTSNTDQKLQVMEQIFMLFNPSLEIQTTDNYVDWTSLSVVNLDSIQFSNRTIPIGVESEIDIGTLSFSTPIFISPPAKVKRLGVITNIIANIFNERNGDIDLGLSQPELRAYSESLHEVSQETTTTTENGEVDIETQRIVTPTLGEQVVTSTTYRDYGLYIENDIARLVYNREVGTTNWYVILDSYPGEYQAGVSQIRLRQENSQDSIVGTFAVTPVDETQISITFDTDTLPTNTILNGPARDVNSYTSIDYIIDPIRYNPSEVTQPGLRFLILGDIGSDVNQDGPDAWKGTDNSDLVASANDIIEYDGTKWVIIFDASENTDTVIYINNLNTSVQYKWTGEEWIKSYEGEYSGGNWMVYLDG